MKPTERFSNTVDYYIHSRPNYPQAVIETIIKECNLNAKKIIADVGMGTGIFAKQLLTNNLQVIGVEPNPDMRTVAAQLLTQYPNFKIIDGSAENTHLPNHSIDLITAATAFHWFDRTHAKQEFLRILKPKGWVALVWNIRLKNGSAIMQAYENLLETYGTNYTQVRSENISDKEVNELFYPSKAEIKLFTHQQIFDWEGFKGRLLSASYTPKPDDVKYEAMIIAAQQAFDQYQQNNTITFLYEAKLYLGQLL